MYDPNRLSAPQTRRYITRMTGALALSSVILVGCSDPTPSHDVIVKQGQTLDDIGKTECGTSFLSALNITTNARRNQIREFNDLPNDTITPGQILKIPDSLCYDTGDKIRDDKAQS